MEDKKELEKQMANVYMIASEGMRENESIQSINARNEVVLAPSKYDIAGVETTITVRKLQGGVEFFEYYSADGTLLAETDETGAIKYTEEFLEILDNIEKRVGKVGKLQPITAKDIEEASKDIDSIEEWDEELAKKKAEEELSNEDKDEPVEEEKEEDEEIDDKENHEDELKEELSASMGIDKDDIDDIVEIDPNEKISLSESFSDITNTKGRYSNVIAAKIKGQNVPMFFGEGKDGIEKFDENILQSSSSRHSLNINKIGKDGVLQESKSVEAAYFVNGDINKAFTIDINQAGRIKVSYATRDQRTGIYIAEELRTSSDRGKNLYETRELFDKNQGIYRAQDAVEKIQGEKDAVAPAEAKINVQDINNNKNDNTTRQDIEADQEIKLEDGTTTTIGVESNMAGISEKTYRDELASDTDGNNISESIENIREKYDVDPEEIAKEAQEEIQEEKKGLDMGEMGPEEHFFYGPDGNNYL